MLPREMVRDLQAQFGRRVSFDPTERRLYGHDQGGVPRMVRPLLGDTRPDAIVQPESESELVEVLSRARRAGVHVTPRARATSGYGGAVPLRRGLVVDVSRMRRVLSVNEDTLTATVEAGIVWKRLDAVLRQKGLTLRLYPTSYPSSTVGGWLAQGGAGIGSFEAGWFRDNVVEARVVLPAGEVRELRGADLDLVSAAEGITGIISQVTLRVQRSEPLEVTTFSTPSSREVQALLEDVVRQALPVWSATVINPTMARLKNEARRAKGRPGSPLPETYLVQLVYRASDSPAVAPALLDGHDVGVLDAEAAGREWEERFELLGFKRLAPSVVPSEAVVPLDRLGAFLDALDRRVRQPLGLEALAVRRGVSGDPEVVVLGFIPSDERQARYNLVYPLALTMIRQAERHGGRVYGTGMFFGRRALRGPDGPRLKQLSLFKRDIDPHGLMNPGKVTGEGRIALLMSVAARMEPVLRPVANAVPVRPTSEPAPRPGRRGVPGDIAYYAYACAQCGYCIDDCTQYGPRGWESQSPRGKWYWLREFMEGREEWSQHMVDTFLLCTTCERCDLACAEALPIQESWLELRGELVEKEKRMTLPAFEVMGAALASEGDIWAGFRHDRGDWFPADLAGQHGPGTTARAVYFGGCTSCYVEQDIAIASVRLLDRAGVDFTFLGENESCCGTPMLVAGKWDLFRTTMERNIRAVKEAGADTVIASCPACDMMWRKVYPEWCERLGIEYGIQARHYSEVLTERLRTGEFRIGDHADPSAPARRVTFHDSCHIGRASGVFEPPRELIRAIPGVELVEMEHNRANALCCGSVLTLVKDPPVAAEMGKTRLEEALATESDALVSLCPCCQFQFRVAAEKKQIPVNVVDLAHLTAGALGYELPDPAPEVQAQWAVFERMIALLTPEGFARLLNGMWPEVVDAMPLGMGRALRGMAHVPGAMSAIRPLFPLLFPRLLPGMMPALLPTLVDRIEGQIPMPDYMKKQLPGLLSAAMANLMPHMLPEVVPLVSQPLVDYLEGPAPRAH